MTGPQPARTVGGHPWPCDCAEVCRPAKDAEAAYACRRELLIIRGQWQPFVDAAPVRAHVKALMAYGIGLDRVAALAAVGGSCVEHLVYGSPRLGLPPSVRIRSEAAQRLLAVQAVPQNLSPRAGVDATGTRRRLQALAACGWSFAQLAPRLGMGPAHVREIGCGKRAVISGVTAARVCGLYDQLWDQAPPERTTSERMSVARTRKHAGRQGYAVPLAWDDDEIDDPAAQPAEGWQRTRTLRRSQDLAEDIAELARWGYDLELAAERLGVTVAAAAKAVQRASMTLHVTTTPPPVTGEDTEEAA